MTTPAAAPVPKKKAVNPFQQTTLPQALLMGKRDAATIGNTTEPASKARKGSCYWVREQFIKEAPTATMVNPMRCKHCVGDSAIHSGKLVTRLKHHLMNGKVCPLCSSGL